MVASFLSEYAYASSPKTHAFHKDQLRALLLWCDAHDVTRADDVTPDLIRGLLADVRARKLAAWTLTSRYESARRFFAWCVEQGHLVESPCATVKRPRKPEPAVTAFTSEEAARLMQHAGNAHGWLGARDRAIVTFFLGTGARADELLRLTEADIDWTRGRVTLHGKGSRDRLVPLGPKVSKTLREYLRARPLHPDPRLWITQAGTVMGYQTLWRMIATLGQYAGVDDCHPHRFRHTSATELGRKSGNILQVKSFLGHAHIATTERYLQRLKAEFGQANYATPDSWL